MSTRETRYALDLFEEVRGKAPVIDWAREELATIRRAAAVLTAEQRGQPYSETERADALALLARIAGEET